MRNTPIAYRVSMGLALWMVCLLAVPANSYLSINTMAMTFKQHWAEVRRTALVAEDIERTYETRLGASCHRISPPYDSAGAGGHGRVCVVIASEVRELAEHSASVASDIGGRSSLKVDLSERGNEWLGSSVGGTGRAAVLRKNISTASSEQSVGTDQITSTIRGMSAFERSPSDQVSRIFRAAPASRDLIETLDEIDGRLSAEMSAIARGPSPRPDPVTATTTELKAA